MNMANSNDGDSLNEIVNVFTGDVIENATKFTTKIYSANKDILISFKASQIFDLKIFQFLTPQNGNISKVGFTFQPANTWQKFKSRI